MSRRGEVSGPRLEDRLAPQMGYPERKPRGRTPQPGTPQPGTPQPPTPPRPRRRRFGFFGRIVGFLLALIVVGGVGGAAAGWHMYERYSSELPTLDGLRHYQPKVMSRLYATDDRLVAELATERRIFVPISAVPERVQQAFISAEDQKFWSHRGVDPFAMARAALYDVMQFGRGRRPIGASTITQQVAKNMLLGNEMSLARKVKELILAVRIEQSMPKEHILELYLNEIYLGLQSYGVAAAAQAYFNKTLDEMTLPEAAFLAVLPKAPNNYNPFRYPEAAKARRDWVLDRMAEDRAITPEQAAIAKATPIQANGGRRQEVVTGGEWFAEEVRRQLVDRFGADLTNTGGYAVRTSLDPALQAAADKALRAGLMAYDRSHGGWRGPVGHLDGDNGMRQGWSNRLAALPRVPGMMPEWNLSVVLEVNRDDAKLGWIERPPGQATGGGTSRVATLARSDVGWARPVRATGLGASPQRMGDVFQVGDVVLTELVSGNGSTARGGSERLLLRQVPSVQGALVSMDPLTGRVLALSGGWSFEASQFNRATQAERQPGSSFKPMVYLTALQAGMSPSQRVLDAPFEQRVGNQIWRPNNYGLSYGGATPIRLALERSLNLVTVRLAERVGIDAVAANAMAFHVVDNMPKVLPAALGAVETTVLRQAAAYAGLAMGGREVLPSFVDSIQDRDGKVIWRPRGLDCQGCSDPARPPTVVDNRRQIADPQSVFQLVTMMQGVVAKGTGFAAGAGLNRAIAGKTGTSQDFTDAWFVGFTPDLVTAVWVGYDNRSSLGEKETGGAISAPIWHDYMAVALKNRPNLTFKMPEGVKMATWESGAGARTDAFKPGQEPGSSQGTVGGGSGGGGEGGEGVAVSGGGGPGVGIDSGVGGLY